MSRIHKIIANFRQVGSLHDRDGAGGDYDIYVVGDRNIVSIVEIDQKGLLTHRVVKSDGTVLELGNVFYVEYAMDCTLHKDPIRPITHDMFIYSCCNFEQDIAIYCQIGEGRMGNDLVQAAYKAVKNLRETIEIKVKNYNNEIEGKK